MNSSVSVVIAAYNRAGYLGETIESALAQTHKPMEVIVVDDGSTDDTRAVVARYEPGVRYLWQPNAERGAARNRGWRLAQGEFVAFLDSDDLWRPDKLQRDLDLFRRRPEVGVVYADVELIDAQGRSLGVRPRPHHEGWVTSDLLRENFVILSAHLMRSAAIREVGGFREERALSGSEDWELWVRLSTRRQFAHVTVPTTRYRAHANNSMSNAAGMERSMRHACALLEAAPYLSPAQRRLIPHAQAIVALVSAINYCSAGERGRTWRHLLEALQHFPGIILDQRFSYTIIRSIFSPRLSGVLQALRAAKRSQRQGRLPDPGSSGETK